ncbi:hypothetical protein KC19_VG084200 [Ceratodon purpureus]|uniref:Uncharacterized protein n=1 Tax=Ceratodon purpureus TaxID=3225 RepID=A0A8T0HNH8_CERPU|nr:hypothetical protein KC19_VG084200 [Ceratodon purpureus]
MVGTEKFKTKSEQMKRANACRKSKGRTGPIGVAGVTERLRVRLGRTPDPEEIQEEVTRDKGGDRRSRRPRLDSVQEGAGEAPFVTNNGSGPAIPLGSAAASDTMHEINHSEEQIHEQNNVEASTVRTYSTLLSTDPDVMFAQGHPLGKVLLKQMNELRNFQGSGTPDLSMVLDGLMQQIRMLRGSTESAKDRPETSPVQVPVSNPPIHSGNSSPQHTDSPRNTSKNHEGTVIPLYEVPVESIQSNELPTEIAPTVMQRKSGRILIKKNRDI